jgi:RND family efflux transporter MFP subunit
MWKTGLPKLAPVALKLLQTYKSQKPNTNWRWGTFDQPNFKVIKIMKTLSVLVITAALTSPLFASSGHEANSAVTPPVVAVQTSKATIQSVPIYAQASGTVRSRHYAVLSPKITGEIVSTRVVTGQSVQTDEILAEISALEIQSRVQGALAAKNKAERDLQREQSLLKSNSSTSELVADLEAQLAMAEATLKEATTMLSHAQIKAPFDGVITRKYANTGDLAIQGNPLFELEDLGNLRVEANVSERVGSTLKLNTQVNIQVAGSQEPLVGTVEEIAPAADPQTRTFPIKIALDKAVDLKSGLFAKVSIPVDSVETVLVDKAAVSLWGQIERVFIVAEGKLALRIIKTGKSFGNKVEVLTGLSGNETLAIGSPAQLIDGAIVE